MIYTINRRSGKTESITHTETGRTFQFDPRNRDYQEFAAWNAAQETPLSLADEAAPEDLDAAEKEADRATAIEYWSQVKNSRLGQFLRTVLANGIALSDLE